MSRARAQELSVAFGFRKQTNITTAAIAGDCWTMPKLNTDPVVPEYVNESDAAQLGKGHEFATTLYKSHVNLRHTCRKFLSSELMAWAASFGLGNSVKSASYLYTCTPLNPVTGGVELPYFSWSEAIRQASGTIWNKQYVGCALNRFLVTVNSQPGRASSQIELEFVGTGKMAAAPITIPAKTTEHELPGSSLALTIIGVDYVTSKKIESLSWGWDNGLVPRYYPGSGSDNSYAIAGAIEARGRTGILNFTVSLESDSAEFTKLLALTTGTAVITQTYSAAHTYTATFQQVGFSSVVISDADGIATVNVTATPQYHSTNGVLTVAALCAENYVCEAPA